MTLKQLQLKKGEDRRIRTGHPWIFSNEVATSLKTFTPGEEIHVVAHDGTSLGVGYVNPHSLIAARLFSRDPTDRLDKSFFLRAMTKALALRDSLFAKPFYRLIYGEADGLPGLIVDRFDEDLVVQINTAGMALKTEIIVDTLRTLLPKTHSILLRNDSTIRHQEGLETEIKSTFGAVPDEMIVEENEVKFTAPLLKGQKTGWFYDHRMNRARLKDYVKDKKVLDVFSYLGAFGIQAACFGARQVDCIDASQVACEYIARNAQLNHVDGKVHVICDDAFDALKNLAREKQTYDVVILDPPAFVKKAKDRKEGLVAYQRINELALKILTPAGILVSCSCSMHVSLEDLLQVLQRAAFRTQSPIQILERGHQGPDHPLHVAIPETDYLKAIFVRKIG